MKTTPLNNLKLFFNALRVFMNAACVLRGLFQGGGAKGRRLAIGILTLQGLFWAGGAAAIDSTQIITTNAPAAANSGQVFTVAASASSTSGVTCGNRIKIVSDGVNCTGSYDSGAGGCLNAGKSVSGNITMATSGTVRCTIDYQSTCTGCLNNTKHGYEYVKVNQVITFNQPADVPLSAADYSPGAIAQTTNLGATTLAVTYTSSTPAVCTIVANKVHNVSAGTCTVTAAQAGDVNFAPATVAGGSNLTRSWQVTKADQTITFGAQAAQTYSSGGTFALTAASASSGLAVSYSSTTPAVCTVEAPTVATVTIVSAGTCTIKADQAGDVSNWNAAPQQSQNITINKATQTITFGANPGPKTYGNAPFAVSATTPSTSPVVFTSTTTGVCTIAGSTVTIVTAGTCTIAANAVADTNYNAAAQATQNIVINKANQTITFNAQAAQTFSVGGTFEISPTATTTSGLAIGYTSTTPGVCTVAGTTVTIVTGGTCTIAADQAGNVNYNAAVQVTQNVTINKINQTITVTTAAPASAAGGSTFPVAATTSSGLGVAVSTSGACSGSGTSTAGSSVTITMTAPSGACAVYFDQAGNASYNAAPQVSNSTSATGLNQTITITTAAPASAAMLSTFPVAATASSGLPVAITASGGCSVPGGSTASATVTMNSSGADCAVVYNQVGNAAYFAAPQLGSTTTATAALQTITVTSAPPANAASGTSFNVAATASSALAVAITVTGDCSITAGGSGTATILMAAGTVCLVHFNQAGGGGYAAAPEVIMGTAVIGAGGSGCYGEGTYTSLRFSDSGGYIGWACNAGDFSAPGHSIGCSPSILDWSIQPGAGFKGHVLQTKDNPGKTFKIQFAPGSSTYYNILNTTDATCIGSGNAVYEIGGTRQGANSSAGYLIAFQDTATVPTAYCDYTATQAKWKINTAAAYVTFETAGYPGGGCMGTDGLGLSRLLLPDPDNYGHWGDSWVRNAVPSCSDSGARMTCGGYAPLPVDHVRFEFNKSGATCGASAVTIKACTNAAGAVGSDSSCNEYKGYLSLTPGASKGTWAGLVSAPSTGFIGHSTGVKLSHTTAESTTFSFSAPSVAPTSAALECYDTSTSKVVNCANALAFSACTFDAVESTAGSALGDRLYTKLANTPFAFDVLMGNSGALVTSYSSTAVNVQLWDATNDVLVQEVGTFNFPAGTGKITVAAGAWGTALKNLAVGNAKLRIRDAAKSATTCNAANFCSFSSDNFTIRPQTLTVTLTNSDDPLVAGKNTNASDSIPSKGFTLAASSGLTATYVTPGPVTTYGYSGVPTFDLAKVYDWSGAAIPAGALTPSNFSADTTNGKIPSGTFYFNEFGVVDFNRANTVVDKTFTALSTDQLGGDCVASSTSNVIDGSGKYGCWIGSAIPVPSASNRFRPAYYTAEVKATPPAPACGVTYAGQSYASATLILRAKSANGDDLSLLRTGATNAPAFFVAGYQWSADLTTAALVGGMSFTDGTALLPTAASPSTAWTTGASTLASASTTIKPTRSTTGPAAPSERVAIALTVNDADGAVFNSTGGCTDGAGNPGRIINAAGVSTTCVAPAGQRSEVRYGVLKIDNSYGSELNDLHVPVTALYFNGQAWVPNREDSCTTLSLNNLSIGAGTGNLAGHFPPAAPITIVNANGGSNQLFQGRALIRIPKPSFTGGVDLVLNLGAAGVDTSCLGAHPAFGTPATYTAGAGLPWLRGNWCGGSAAGYTKDPNARITFGTPKNPYIYMREKY